MGKSALSLLALISVFSTPLKAQDSSRSVKMPLYLHSSFFYDFPQSFGISTGAEFPIKSKAITTQFKNGKKELRYRDLIAASDIGFYRYAFNNTGIYFFESVGKRYNKSSPYYFEWLIKVGVLRTFYDGEVYSVDDNGNVKILKNYGRYYALTGFTFVFGHNFERGAKPRPYSIEFKPSIWVQYPYNSFFLTHFSAEVSFKYHFKKLNILMKQKQIVHILTK